MYLDPFAGIAGDMFLGLLLDLGVEDEKLANAFERLGIRFDFAVTPVSKNGIAAIHTRVSIPEEGEDDEDDECGCGHEHDHGHEHERDENCEHEHAHHHANDHEHHHAHGHEHSHGDENDTADGEAVPHGHGMSLDEILEILDRLDEPTRGKARDMFLALVEAEAQVHGSTVDSVHLHETGAIDAIVEIVGAIKGLELLGVERVVCGTVNTGTGYAQMAHGTYPVPAPATAELLKGIPVRMDGFSHIRKELVTPTGALILSHLVDEFAPISMTVERVGYGAGTRDMEIPNVLRGFLGHSEEAAGSKRLMLLESNIDDMNPELYGHLMETLYRRGALDVFFTSVQMKKNRPGVRVSVLGEPHDKATLIDALMKESTTLGVRVTYPERYEAEREVIEVNTDIGTARVKIATYDGEVVNVSPEYDSCRLLSTQSGVPLKQVYVLALQAARIALGSEGSGN
ncbi:MAG: nickel pincer cofactor biosynthesis protein LarC [Chloroflexota bacterium]